MNETKQQTTMLPRTALFENADGMREVDIRSLHLSKGRIFLEGDITSETANWFAAAMLRLADEQEDAFIFINSPGGEVNAGLMMYDILRSFPGRLTVVCTGLAASMGAVLFAAGQKGRRFILPHSKVMIHEPLIAGGMGGSATSIEKTAQNILGIKALLNGILSECTGRTVEEINRLTKEDYYMDAQQAVDLGICDGIKSLFEL